MKTNNFFNIKRTLLLIKRMMFVNKKTFFIGFGIYFGIMLIFFLLSLLNDSFINPASIKSTSFNFMFIWGLIITSMIFREIHKSVKAFSYLTLPVTHFERFLSTWLIISLSYTLVFTFIIYLVMALGCYIGNLSPENNFISPDLSDIVKSSLYYMIIQTVFLYGSVFFKKSQWIKTVLSLIIFIAIIIVGMVFIYRYEISDVWHGGIGQLQNFDKIFLDIYKFNFISLITFYIMPLALLTATYFRIKEKEI